MLFKLFKKKSSKDRKTQDVKKSKTKSQMKKKTSKKEVGRIIHYFPKVKVGVVKITSGYLNAGDLIYIKGHTTDFKQKVTSIEIDNKPVLKVQKPKEAGILVKSRVRIKDKVYKLTAT